MENDGLRAEGEFLVLFGLCREQLENHVLETALVYLCSARESHEGGEHNIMILAAVQEDVLSTTQHRQNSGRFWLLDFILAILDFSSHGISVRNVKSWGGELNMTWFNI